MHGDGNLRDWWTREDREQSPPGARSPSVPRPWQPVPPRVYVSKSFPNT
jgi:hypothetical protein